MARNYRHVQEYEGEILSLKTQGFTKREIGSRLGLSPKQVHNFITRYNRRREKLAAGIEIRPKGRPAKDYVITEDQKASELRYIIARKDARIKTLEMENALLRDFLQSTGRK